MKVRAGSSGLSLLPLPTDRGDEHFGGCRHPVGADRAGDGGRPFEGLGGKGRPEPGRQGLEGRHAAIMRRADTDVGYLASRKRSTTFPTFSLPN